MILPRELLLDCDTSVMSLGHNFRPLNSDVSFDQEDLAIPQAANGLAELGGDTGSAKYQFDAQELDVI